jgi:prevent-host-death family protein
MANRIQAAKARRDFSNVVDRCARGERIKVTRYGRTLAVIVPKGDLAKLEDCEQDRKEAAARPHVRSTARTRR